MKYSFYTLHIWLETGTDVPETNHVRPSKNCHGKNAELGFITEKSFAFVPNINIYLYWYNTIVIFSFIKQQITNNKIPHTK